MRPDPADRPTLLVVAHPESVERLDAVAVTTAAAHTVSAVADRYRTLLRAAARS